MQGARRVPARRRGAPGALPPQGPRHAHHRHGCCGGHRCAGRRPAQAAPAVACTRRGGSCRASERLSLCHTVCFFCGATVAHHRHGCCGGHQRDGRGLAQAAPAVACTRRGAGCRASGRVSPRDMVCLSCGATREHSGLHAARGRLLASGRLRPRDMVCLFAARPGGCLQLA